MPVTPRFSVEQTDDFVCVTIRVPHIRVSAAETHVEEDGCGVSFYCKPYLLKLRLPLPVRGEDDERCRAVYDPAADGGTVVLHLPKATAGQHFPDLDLTSALLQPKWDPSKELADRAAERAAEGGTGIEVLASSTATDAPDSDDEVEVEDGSAPPPDAPCGDDDLGLGLGLGLARPSYGFNQAFSGFFRGLREELREMAQLPDPDATPEHERRAQREHAESLAFDEGRYLGDLLGAEEDVIFTEALAYQPDWINADSGFTEEEQAQMAQLPRKEYLIRAASREEWQLAASREEWQLFQGLADIIFGYAYDQRTTQGEGNVESAWTIATLSATLSWFEVWGSNAQEAVWGSNAQEAVAASARRSLCYPYLRHWQLTRACLGDVAAALRGGRRAALRCLLRIHATLARSEFHYLHNKPHYRHNKMRARRRPEFRYLHNEVRARALYVSDYCVWLQMLGNDDNLREYANAYAEASAALTKEYANAYAEASAALTKVAQWLAWLTKTRPRSGTRRELPDLPQRPLPAAAARSARQPAAVLNSAAALIAHRRRSAAARSTRQPLAPPEALLSCVSVLIVFRHRSAATCAAASSLPAAALMERAWALALPEAALNCTSVPMRAPASAVPEALLNAPCVSAHRTPPPLPPAASVGLGLPEAEREYQAALLVYRPSVGLGLPEAEREYQAALFGPRSADTDDASGGLGSGGGGGSSGSSSVIRPHLAALVGPHTSGGLSSGGGGGSRSGDSLPSALGSGSGSRGGSGGCSDESDSESSSDDESYSDASLLSGSDVHPAAATPPTTRGDAATAAAAAAAAPATPAAFSCTAAAAAAAAGAAAAPVENAQDSGHAAAAAARETHAAAAAAAGVEHRSALLNNAEAPMLPPPPSPAVSSVATPIATDAAETDATATSDGSAGPQPAPSDGLDVPLPPPLSPAATADAAVEAGVCGRDGAKATHQRPLCVNPPSPPPCEGDREASVLRLLGGVPELTRRAAALSISRGADAEHENSTQAALIQEL
ncbi:SHQ1 protein-domain-containing protein [Tribonema minus]|uniref:SHQ1 protein-domain-containing protein n=1 Tax=Tribonema minus TaxID=303371 RepID=A0A835YXH0_9STRA|nr:SHQ1 protein-domain-containing protein [Tribonema minus]